MSKTKAVIAFKLFRKLKDGNITSLFINKTERLNLNTWLKAESYPTKGFALRPFFHCTAKPKAPHLKTEGRIWLKVEMREFTEMIRPDYQGSLWYLANEIKILNEQN